jgi:phosphate acetyltransferase
MGVSTPKVAILSAVETVNPNIPSTLDAAALCKMADRGPDHRWHCWTARWRLTMPSRCTPRRSNTSPPRWQGHADIMAVPDLESRQYAGQTAGVSGGRQWLRALVLGARVPIALTSRAEGPMNRVASALLGLMVAHNARRNHPRLAW